MDFGHKTYWERLKMQRAEIQGLLVEAEEKGYDLFLRKQNAFWVLDQQETRATDDRCGGGPESDDEKSGSPSTSPHIGVSAHTRSPSPVEPAEVEDPLDVAIRVKCFQCREIIRVRLASYATVPQSKFYQERFNFIFACVRRAIYTDASLTLLASNYKSVKALLKDTSLELPIIEKLRHAVWNFPVDLMRAAVDDAIRPSGVGNQEHVVLLGGKVFKEASGVKLPLHAWGHLVAVCHCYGCIRNSCTTLEEIVEFTKYVELTEASLKQTQSRYQWPDVPGMRWLVLCGFIPNDLRDIIPRSVITKINCSYLGKHAHWKETRTNQVLCAGLPLGDPKTQAFVDACLRHPDFLVLARRGKDGPIVRSHPFIVASFTRWADTRAALKRAQWDGPETVFWSDSVLEEAMPRLGPNRHIEDCFQIAIVDNGEGQLKDLVDKLVSIWMQLWDVKSEFGLANTIVKSYIDVGELEIRKGYREGDEIGPWLPHVERDLLKSFQRLWDTTPQWVLLKDSSQSGRRRKPEAS
ncbi:hypothetical protein FA95DRAFT_1515848 [Auriscalpium vulgare]|uniref:Uncharacterized protein n=1 Tax=Auriscalpium vulgare TaxID=40419 RepID=A0ACB8RZC6_9AGAM|nr:hypothetical protein FA95DRAFT_1515848 [Auriscalpium vulgare]